MQLVTHLSSRCSNQPGELTSFDSVEYNHARGGLRMAHPLPAFHRRLRVLHRRLPAHVQAFLYGSYRAPRELLWLIGMLVYLALMAEAFMGYVLPWGNMSFWGAQVIVNLFGTIPGIGTPLVE